MTIIIIKLPNQAIASTPSCWFIMTMVTVDSEAKRLAPCTQLVSQNRPCHESFIHFPNIALQHTYLIYNTLGAQRLKHEVPLKLWGHQLPCKMQKHCI
jgi:hypothetical protein